MTPAYLCRIVALIGNEVTELARFQSYPFPSAVRCVTNDLCAKKWWMEWTLKDKDCITPRWRPPVSATEHNNRARRARLSR